MVKTLLRQDICPYTPALQKQKKPKLRVFITVLIIIAYMYTLAEKQIKLFA